VRRHLDEEWTLDSMAGRCGIKRTRFAGLCRELTGYTPLHYVGRLRFEQACRLLRETKKTITEITFDCGYSSSQYFAAQFKKAAGMTPTEYRRLAPDLEHILATNWKNPEDRTLEAERLRRSALQPGTPLISN
jgi:AraC-like DNA-binding protein